METSSALSGSGITVKQQDNLQFSLKGKQTDRQTDRQIRDIGEDTCTFMCCNSLCQRLSLSPFS